MLRNSSLCCMYLTPPSLHLSCNSICSIWLQIGREDYSPVIEGRKHHIWVTASQGYVVFPKSHLHELMLVCVLWISVIWIIWWLSVWEQFLCPMGWDIYWVLILMIPAATCRSLDLKQSISCLFSLLVQIFGNCDAKNLHEHQGLERPKEPGLSSLRTVRELQEGMVSISPLCCKS